MTLKTQDRYQPQCPQDRMHCARRGLLLGALATPFLFRAARAQGVDIHVLSSGSFRAAYERLGPQFERQTGHRLVNAFGASFGSAPEALPQRLARGEPADVLLALADGLEDLATSGHLNRDSITPLAESRVAFVVRAGTPRPDMSSVEALRAALLAAPSIAYSPSGSGLYFERELLPRLGIAEQVMPRARRWTSGWIGDIVARGDAALGLQQISEVMPIKGVEVIHIPEEVQKVSIVAAGVAARAQQPEAARQLIAFLGASEAAPTIAATGLNPLRR